MQVENSEKLLENFEYYHYYNHAETPKQVETKFEEITPLFREGGEKARGIAQRRLFVHQLDVLKQLEQSSNVILMSGTGSGKTEAWVLHTLKNAVKTLIIYPTLALSQDQVNRLEDYYSALGTGTVFKAEQKTTTGIKGHDSKSTRMLKDEAREKINNSTLLITNPAFLMSDLKRAIRNQSPFLSIFLAKTDLIIIDELDYYGSSKATLLILGIVAQIIKLHSRTPPQVCILTATLGNPETLAQTLTQLNGHRTSIIQGKPFKVRNNTYIIMGRKKEVGIQENSEEDPDRVIKTNSGLLAHYASTEGSGITIAFTSSIKQAERLARKVKGLIPSSANRVAIHHSGVPARKRELIEAAARTGDVKLIFSPKTLTQGIDISNIVRIVHLGLPWELREFLQREGRKGRREEIPFTETIIIPSSKWDNKLFEKGHEYFIKWSELPLEYVFINPENKYLSLLRTLTNMFRHSELTSLEIELVKQLQIGNPTMTLRGKEWKISGNGIQVWKFLNFYSYGPPYGKRKIFMPGKKILDTQITDRDFVEKYQPGCFDFSTDLVVVGRTENFDAIIEREFSDAEESCGFIGHAMESYKIIKYDWNETVNFPYDYRSGRVQHLLGVTTIPPNKGFGELIEYPLDVKWIIESAVEEEIFLNNEQRTYRKKEFIDLNVMTSGEYRLLTYGKSFELDPNEDLSRIKIGLCYLLGVLRLSEETKLSLKEIKYSVTEGEPVKAIILWEPEPIGLLENFDWAKARRAVAGHSPDFLTEVIMWSIDQDAVYYMLTEKVDWNEVKTLSLKVLDYLQEILWINLKGERFSIEKPARSLKIGSLILIPFVHRGNRIMIYCFFDGENYSDFDILRQDEGDYSTFYDSLLKFVDDDFLILCYPNLDLIQDIIACRHTINIVVSKYKEDGKLVDMQQLIKGTFDHKVMTLEFIESFFQFESNNFKRTINYQDLRLTFHNLQKADLTPQITEQLHTFAKETTQLLYCTYLACLQLKKENLNRINRISKKKEGSQNNV